MQGSCGVDPPEGGLMVGNVVEESSLVQVRANRECVDVPRACFAPDLEAVEALAHVWPFANGDKPARAIIQLLPADAQHDPVFLFPVAYFEVRCLKIESPFVN